MTALGRFEGRAAALVGCVAMAVGCSASDGQDGGFGSGGGGTGGTGGSTGEPGGSSAAGAAGSSEQGQATLPDPGPPPAAAVGVLMASKIVRAGEPTQLGMSAMFTHPALNLGTTAAQAMLSGYENVPLDGCRNINAGPQTVSSDQPNLIDAGDIHILGPDGQTYAVPKQQFANFVFYEAQLPSGAYLPMGEYRLIGAGWEGPFWAPGELEVTAPALDAPVAVPRSKPFTLRWTGKPDGHPVMVFLIQGSTVMTCRAVDDGQFDVPSAALMAFERSGGAFDPSPDEADEVLIERMTWYPVAVNGGIATALVQFEVGARMEVSFE